MTIPARTYERTPYEARLDVAYSARYHGMNERFYRHLDVAFGFVGLFGGTAAFTAAIGQWQTVGVVAGAGVAAGAILERLLRPVEKSAEHRLWREKATDLLARIDAGEAPTLEAIDPALRQLQGRSPPGLTALEIPAYNANLRTHGRTDATIEQSTWSRMVALLA